MNSFEFLSNYKEKEGNNIHKRKIITIKRTIKSMGHIRMKICQCVVEIHKTRAHLNIVITIKYYREVNFFVWLN